MRGRGLSAEAIHELARWYEAEGDRRSLGCDQDELDRDLRRRLAEYYGVLPKFIETEFERVRHLVSHG